MEVSRKVTNFVGSLTINNYIIMEKRLFVIFIFVVSVLYGLKAQEPYFVMSYDSNDRATLYLYYDDNRVERQGTNLKWVLPFDTNRQWETNRNKDIVKVIIDPSFASYSMDNTDFWFFNCSSLEEIEGFQFLNTSNVKSVKCMFWECSSLKSLDLSSFRTDNVTGMAYMFKGCSGLTSLDLSTFRTDSLRYVSYMFEGCSNLTTITVGDEWPRNKFISATDMFLGCDSLVGGAGTRYADMGWSAANARYARIDRGETAPGYFSGEIQNDQLINSLYYNFDHENMTAEVWLPACQR